MTDWRVYQWEELITRLRRLPGQELHDLLDELTIRIIRLEGEVEDLRRVNDRLRREANPT